MLRVWAMSAASRLIVCVLTTVPPTIFPVTAQYSVWNGRNWFTSKASVPRPHMMPLSWISFSGGMPNALSPCI